MTDTRDAAGERLPFEMTAREHALVSFLRAELATPLHPTARPVIGQFLDAWRSGRLASDTQPEADGRLWLLRMALLGRLGRMAPQDLGAPAIWHETGGLSPARWAAAVKLALQSPLGRERHPARAPGHPAPPAPDQRTALLRFAQDVGAVADGPSSVTFPEQGGTIKLTPPAEGAQAGLPELTVAFASITGRRLIASRISQEDGRAFEALVAGLLALPAMALPADRAQRAASCLRAGIAGSAARLSPTTPGVARPVVEQVAQMLTGKPDAGVLGDDPGRSG